MVPDVPAWLLQDVPLWAFLVALLTHPSTWSDRVQRLLSDRFGPASNDNQPTNSDQS